MRDYDDKHRADEMLGPRAACEAVSGGLRCTYSDVVYRTELEGSAARDSQPGRPLILVFDGDSFLIRIEEYRWQQKVQAQGIQSSFSGCSHVTGPDPKFRTCTFFASLP